MFAWMRGEAGNLGREGVFTESWRAGTRPRCSGMQGLLESRVENRDRMENASYVFGHYLAKSSTHGADSRK
jgi:hypothetical protein